MAKDTLLKSQAQWPYPVGVRETPWGPAERKQWCAHVTKHGPLRSYEDDVLNRINRVARESEFFQKHFEVLKYGQLSHDQERYPLFAVRSKRLAVDGVNADGTSAKEKEKQNSKRLRVLVTGGVHGYETSGVHGALRFIEDHLTGQIVEDRTMIEDENGLDFVVAPCVSPWGYEYVQRWQIDAIDVNRSFLKLESGEGLSGGSENATPSASNTDSASSPSSSPYVGEKLTEESTFLTQFLQQSVLYGPEGFDLHMDLHETTDTDSTEFTPAKQARDGKDFSWNKDRGVVPSGFYTIGDCTASDMDRQKRFHQTIIEHVGKITKISPNKVVGVVVDDRFDEENGDVENENRVVTKTTIRESKVGHGVIEEIVEETDEPNSAHPSEADDPTYPTDGSLIYPLTERIGPANPTGTCAPSLAGGPTSVVTTTEVYPDLEGVTAEECERAQVVAVLGGIAFIRGESQ